MADYVEFTELVGKVVQRIDRKYDDIRFYCGEFVYYFDHSQECCESVELIDICGDLDDLLNTPIIVADKRIGCDHELPDGIDDGLWTFFELRTIKGSVTLRWLGQDDSGNYSVDVDFYKKLLG